MHIFLFWCIDAGEACLGRLARAGLSAEQAHIVA